MGDTMGIDIFQNKDTRHKVFISYYHKDDQPYKDAFEKAFSHFFINKSVQDGDINTDVSTEYIKQLIQKDFITDASVLVVLFGPNTWGRKHVDWEISAVLNKKLEDILASLELYYLRLPYLLKEMSMIKIYHQGY